MEDDWFQKERKTEILLTSEEKKELECRKEIEIDDLCLLPFYFSREKELAWKTTLLHWLVGKHYIFHAIADTVKNCQMGVFLLLVKELGCVY